MFSIRKLFFKFVILLLATGGASAGRMAKIMYYQAPVEAPEYVFVYQSKKQPEEVKLERQKFSLSFELEAGDRRLVFLPKELPEDMEMPAGSPFVMIPATWDKVILFVTEDEKNPVMPIRVHAFDASDRIFGPGDILFINQCDLAVGGMVGDERITMKPKTAKVLGAPLGERGEFNLMLDSYDQKSKQRRNLVRKRWLHIPEFRNVVFITKLPPPAMAKIFVAEIRSF